MQSLGALLFPLTQQKRVEAGGAEGAESLTMAKLLASPAAGAAGVPAAAAWPPRLATGSASSCAESAPSASTAAWRLPEGAALPAAAAVLALLAVGVVGFALGCSREATRPRFAPMVEPRSIADLVATGSAATAAAAAAAALDSELWSFAW